jgi:pimeloyl-ACP methyl ester carboxylesterase
MGPVGATERPIGPIAVGDIQLSGVAAGEGTPVLFLHGFPETSYSWRKQLPALAAQGFRAIAVDLRGYAGSSKPREIDAYRLTELVKDVAGVATQLGARQIVAHDWGGAIAWLLAMLHPTVVDRLVVMNSAHPVPLLRELRRFRQKIRFSYQLYFQPPLLPELTMPRLLPWMMRRSARFTEEEIAVMQEAWRDRDSRRAMANYYRALRHSRGALRSLLRKIDIPVLYIFGMRDPVFLPETADGYGEWVPNVRVERIADAGHFVQTDAPERVNELLLGFLER